MPRLRPAAVVDLCPGGLIVAVNGGTVRGSDLEEVRQMFMPEGQQFSLRIQLGSDTLEKVFTTKRVIRYRPRRKLDDDV